MEVFVQRSSSRGWFTSCTCFILTAFLVSVVVFLHSWAVMPSSMQKQRHVGDYMAGNFTPIAPGEFYLLAPTVSPQEIEEFFRVPETNENLRALQRAQPFFWQCHESALPRTPPLVFLHIPRSAGSSVRMLLKGFASYCGATLAVIVNCLDPGYRWITTNQTMWVNAVGSAAEGTNCAIERLEPPDPTKFNTTIRRGTIDTLTPVTWSALRGVDIFVGRLPIGLPGNPAYDAALYWTMFRNPLEEWVSLHIIYEELETVDAVVQSLQTLLASRNTTTPWHYYFPTSSVFLTPYQKEWVRMTPNIVWTPERRLRVVQQNLHKYPVVIGLAEDWTNTLRLFQSIIDTQNNVTSLFRYLETAYAKEPSLSDSTHLTRQVVQRIQTNDTFRAAAAYYLRYEQQLYDYAVGLHQAQVQWILREQTR